MRIPIISSFIDWVRGKDEEDCKPLYMKNPDKHSPSDPDRLIVGVKCDGGIFEDQSTAFAEKPVEHIGDMQTGSAVRQDSPVKTGFNILASITSIGSAIVAAKAALQAAAAVKDIAKSVDSAEKQVERVADSADRSAQSIQGATDRVGAAADKFGGVADSAKNFEDQATVSVQQLTDSLKGGIDKTSGSLSNGIDKVSSNLNDQVPGLRADASSSIGNVGQSGSGFWNSMKNILGNG